MLRIDLYKNKNQESRNFGKVYGRVNNLEPVGIQKLAEHIASHGSPFTVDTIYGVLIAAVRCIRELALGGQPVKIDNLAIFKASVISVPAVSVEKFDLQQNIKKTKLLCQATGDCVPKQMTASSSLMYTSLAQKLKNGEATLSNEKGKYLETQEP